MHKRLRICLIGNGTQSKRIQAVLKKKKIKFNIFCPKKKTIDKKNKNFLRSFNTFFIISPNSTHFKYLKLLRDRGYIFCEKPPVNKISDLKKLKRIKSNKIFYNFNFRFSKLAEILKNTDKYKLGNLRYINIISGHALGLKKDYASNWRSKKQLCPKGIYEMVSIHWIDLINFLFKIKSHFAPTFLNLSKSGSSIDNCNTRIMLKGKTYVDIFTSYTSPLIKRKLFVFQNGLIEQNNNFLQVNGPALNINKDNLVVEPKTILKYKINEKKDKSYSLTKSIEYFLSKVKNKSNFSSKEIRTSLNTTEILIKRLNK